MTSFNSGYWVHTIHHQLKKDEQTFPVVVLMPAMTMTLFNVDWQGSLLRWPVLWHFGQVAKLDWGSFRNWNRWQPSVHINALSRRAQGERIVWCNATVKNASPYFCWSINSFHFTLSVLTAKPPLQLFLTIRLKLLLKVARILSGCLRRYISVITLEACYGQRSIVRNASHIHWFLWGM